LFRLSTRELLPLLDLMLLPRPQADGERHAFGVLHSDADLKCHCWEHRECIDLLVDPHSAATQGFVNGLVALGALWVQGVIFAFRYLAASHRTYLEVIVNGTFRYLGVVHAFGFDSMQVTERLFGDERVPLFDVGYLILGTSGHARPLVDAISSARVSPTGGSNAARATPPIPRIKYQEDFLKALEGGALPALVHELLAA